MILDGTQQYTIIMIFIIWRVIMTPQQQRLKWNQEYHLQKQIKNQSAKAIIVFYIDCKDLQSLFVNL